MKNLQFANKTSEDVKMLDRFNEVAELMEALEKLPVAKPLAGNSAYKAVRTRGYVHVPRIVSIPPPTGVDQFDDSDFSVEIMKSREQKGYTETKRVLVEQKLRA
jgi:hypothetical protein